MVVFAASTGTLAMAVPKGMTRREVLAGAAQAAAAASLGGLAGCFPSVGGNWSANASDGGNDGSLCSCTPGDGGGSSASTTSNGPVAGQSTVVSIQRDDSVDARGQSTAQPQLDAVQAMVDAVLSALAGGASNPWPALLPGAGSCTRIGLKVNCLNSYFGTSPAIVRALITSLVANLGVCPSNIIVWDRRLDELQTVGRYGSDDLQGAQLLGTLASTTSTAGPGYTDPVLTLQGSTPRLSHILTEMTDVTINCPVLKVHGQTGFTAGMKNVFGIIDVPGNFHTASSPGVDIQTALPAIYNIPAIRGSLKLHIVDALQAVLNGDTDTAPNAIPGYIFASLDTLALDHYALDLINQLRAKPPFRMQPVNAPPPDASVNTLFDWMDNAYQLGLGTKGYQLVMLQPNGEPVGVDGGSEGLDGSTDGSILEVLDSAG